MTAKTDKGAVIDIGKKEYWELGMDLDGDHRLGAWQIKEIIDLTLPPRNTTKERFVAELPPDTKNAEIEIKVTYFPSGPTGKPVLELHKVVKKLNFEK
ncbi:MAG TPA: hypothetical protein VEI96_08135 [Thermodesulfovibrionales bacterium]|nr:hypothetical protein [Thermodesulfovibrionales bacterium]